MKRIKKIYDHVAPRFIIEGWEYLDTETEKWKLKSGAPAWAKKEFDEYYTKARGVYNEKSGVTTLY